MPCHPDRVRTAPLPRGYQFGDAKLALSGATMTTDGVNYTLMSVPPWRAPHENAAERNARYQDEYEAGPI